MGLNMVELQDHLLWLAVHNGGVPLLQMSSSDRCLPCQLYSAKSSAGGVRSSDRREGIHECNRLGGVYEECAGGERFHGGGRSEADGGAAVGHPVFFQQFALQELEAPGFHALIAAKPGTGAAHAGSGPTDLLEVPLKPQPQWTHFSSLANGQCSLSNDSSQNAMSMWDQCWWIQTLTSGFYAFSKVRFILTLMRLLIQPFRSCNNK